MMVPGLLIQEVLHFFVNAVKKSTCLKLFLSFKVANGERNYICMQLHWIRSTWFDFHEYLNTFAGSETEI